MKKFLTVCVILFIINIGCKKTDFDGTQPCACSPTTLPELNLVIKNNAGNDLLNTQTAGFYSKEKITIYKKDATDKIIPISFHIRPPFSYGDEKFLLNSLSLDMTFLLQSPGNIIYLKLGDGKVYELSLPSNPIKYPIDILLIDKKEVEKDKGTVAKYISIFNLIE